MASFTENPFAVLTIVVAPAILTNASSILCLGTANRLALVVDRRRIVSAELARLAPKGESRLIYQLQLHGLEVRSNLLVLRSLGLFYLSLGSFAASTLISIFGSAFSITSGRAGFTAIVLLALLSGTVGVVGLVAGCTMMVQETRLAVRTLAEESQLKADPSGDL
jgi:hypothetical protein